MHMPTHNNNYWMFTGACIVRLFLYRRPQLTRMEEKVTRTYIIISYTLNQKGDRTIFKLWINYYCQR